jgi:NADPH-dependent curcumin reductase CurA
MDMSTSISTLSVVKVRFTTFYQPQNQNLTMIHHPVLDVMLTRMKRWGKIAAVGAIAAYNDESKSAYPNWKEVIANRLTITGFIVFDFMSEYASAAAKLAEAVRDGRFILEGSEEVHEIAFEQVPALWRGLFTGANTGKLVTKLRS